jgi:ATP-dependent DNA ligase
VGPATFHSHAPQRGYVDYVGAAAVTLRQIAREGDAEDIFRHACKLKLEGIVSKLRRSVYRSGRSPDWIKMKNPDCDAVRREAEENWGHDR